MLSFDKIRAERERQKLWNQVRQLREEERQRRKAMDVKNTRQREADRRQRDEAHKIQREKEMLRYRNKLIKLSCDMVSCSVCQVIYMVCLSLCSGMIWQIITFFLNNFPLNW